MFTGAGLVRRQQQRRFLTSPPQSLEGIEMSGISSKATTVARILVGLIFFVFGLNGFFNFIPAPAHTGSAGAFLGGLAASGYFFPFLKLTETIAGAALLANRYVPLALAVLAPVVLNIFAFHVALEPESAAVAVVLLGLEVFLAWSYRAVYRPMLAAKVTPAATTARTELRPSPAE
jgi:uncharacterized membrane protein YphA (DoxX/SURF4 family)